MLSSVSILLVPRLCVMLANGVLIGVCGSRSGERGERGQACPLPQSRHSADIPSSGFSRRPVGTSSECRGWPGWPGCGWTTPGLLWPGQGVAPRSSLLSLPASQPVRLGKYHPTSVVCHQPPLTQSEPGPGQGPDLTNTDLYWGWLSLVL